MSEFEQLKGKTVTKVFLSKDKCYLTFLTSDGSEYNYFADGDCCSNSWFNNLNGLDNLIGSEVIDTVDKPEREALEDEQDGEGKYHECLQFYGFTIKTKRGYCDIEMRNSSNGYYGGMVDDAISRGDDATEVKEDF